MEQLLLVLFAILTLITSGISTLHCYQCYINPPLGEYYNTTRLCVHFDHSERYVVKCPYSTMCVKQEIQLDIQDGVRISSVIRDCASQTHTYSDYIGGKWYQKTDIVEPYPQGCHEIDDKGERTSSSRYCYCKGDLCNSSPKTNHEGYTDIMGVIVVFNLMKYIRSLR